jgi:pyridinium-3,5-bisthiocarboxylic acid mononucleotide nickel chelatase
VPRLLHFDCFSGISGDMTLAALLDLGVPEVLVQEALNSLELPGKLVVSKIKKSGMAATYIKVEAEHEHKHRHLKHVNEIIERGKLTPNAKRIAMEMFLKLAEAEAAVHATTIEKVHFHEVGAVDSIFDFVGCAVGFDHLGIDEYTSRSVPTGSGMVQCDHGLMPIPAPATALLLKGVPLAEGDVSGELTTPTGAAILKTLVGRFGSAPAMTIEKIGVGAGTRDLPDRPNVLRLLLGDSVETRSTDDRESDTIWQLETNIDDAPAEVVGYTIERLFAAGALDVFSTPIQMKKLRPGVLLTVLCSEGDRHAIEAILFEETGTLGIRRSKKERSKLPRREAIVKTKWGEIAGKCAWDGSRWRFSPEYDACAAVAKSSGVPFRDVFQAALAAFTSEPPIDVTSR